MIIAVLNGCKRTLLMIKRMLGGFLPIIYLHWHLTMRRSFSMP